MSVQVSFKMADVAKIAKINKEMAILKLVLQKNRQRRTMGLLLSSKMGQLLLIKLVVPTVPYMTFRKWHFSICFWGSHLWSLTHSMSYS